MAADGGSLPAGQVAAIERIIDRLPWLCGSDLPSSLLHGDAQHHNAISTVGGAVLVDPCPYFGHAEVDLAMVDLFHPVPTALLDGYSDVVEIDPGFGERRELWRMHAYLAIVSVDGLSSFGQHYVEQLRLAVTKYR